MIRGRMLLAGLGALLSPAVDAADPQVAQSSICDGVLTISVPGGHTNSLAQCSGVTRDEMIRRLNENAVTNITKVGLGGIRLDTEDQLKTYTGSVFVREGTYIANNQWAVGSNEADPVGAVHVFDGATLDNRSGGDWGICRRVYFEGRGVDGQGALVASSRLNCANGSWGANLVMTGDALMSDVSPSGDVTLYAGKLSDFSTFCMNGHALYVRARKAPFHLRSHVKLDRPGDIHLTGTTQLFIEEYRPLAAGGDSGVGRRIFVGPEASVLMKNSRQAPSFWTLVWSNETQKAVTGDAAFANHDEWDPAFRADDISNRRFWSGPVELHTDMTADTRTMNLTFQGPVSGEGGLHVGSSPAKGGTRAQGVLHLCADNAFRGGLDVSGNQVVAWTDGAIPDEGDFRCANGSVVFKSQGTLSLPDAHFEGEGAVENGTGSWRNALVKDGEGVLVYKSRLDIPLLDLRRGAVAFRDWTMTDAQLKSETGGLVAGRKFFETLEEATNCLFSSDQVFTNRIQWAVRAANSWYDEMWKADAGETTSSNCLITYSGYLNVEGTSPVTWTFLSDVCDYSRLLIDDVEVIRQIGTATAQKATLTLTPGFHRLNYRIGYGAWKAASNVPGGAPGGGPTSAATNVIKGEMTDCGFLIDKQGRDSLVLDDYVKCNGGEDLDYRWCDPSSDRDLVHPVSGTRLADAHACAVRDVSARPGTAISYASEMTRHVDGFRGFASLAGADVVIERSWSIDCADLVEGGSAIASDHAVAFGPSSVLSLENPDAVRGPGAVYAVLTADGGVVGMPAFEQPTGCRSIWSLSKSEDGKSLLLKRERPGACLVIR